MAHFEDHAASPPPSSSPEHSDLNVTTAVTNALLEDTMKFLAEAESRLEFAESRTSFGDNKLGEMIINTSSDNLDINLHADDTSTDKSECVSSPPSSSLISSQVEITFLVLFFIFTSGI